MQTDNSALPPESFQLDAEPIKEVEAQAVAVAQEGDKEYAALLGVRGWGRVSKEMSGDIEMFKTGGFIKDVEKLSLEEVGKLFVIHQTVATFLQKYLDRVEGAAKAVASAERANQPK